MAYSANVMLMLLVRDAERQGLPGNTVYSFGYWQNIGSLDNPERAFNPRLRVTLDEIREACSVKPDDPPVPGEVR